MGRSSQAPIGSLPTRADRVGVSECRPSRPTDQRQDTKSVVSRGQTRSGGSFIMLTVVRVALAADRQLNAGVGQSLGVANG